MEKEQLELAIRMKQKCLEEAHKAATNLDIEKAQLMYHEARVWQEAAHELQYGYKVAA